jgi:hypothetical protein
VPDHIINKPGRLTPEEFEKMKIHPIVGADILEKVAFPILWLRSSGRITKNGMAWAIRMGSREKKSPSARVSSRAVDCLDALASDRQYRKALPLDEAMKLVAAEAGTSFDPKVVEILQRRYRELEATAVRSLENPRKIHTASTTVERGEKPGAGFEADLNRRRGSQADFLSSIASARQEAHTLFELSQDLGNSLSLDETLSLVAMRLRKLVPYDSIVAFIRKGDLLVPEFVSGDNFGFCRRWRSRWGPVSAAGSRRTRSPSSMGIPRSKPGFASDPRKAWNSAPPWPCPWKVSLGR